MCFGLWARLPFLALRGSEPTQKTGAVGGRWWGVPGSGRTSGFGVRTGVPRGNRAPSVSFKKRGLQPSSNGLQPTSHGLFDMSKATWFLRPRTLAPGGRPSIPSPSRTLARQRVGLPSASSVD